MISKSLARLFLSFIVIAITALSSYAQQDSVTKKTAVKWVKAGTWTNGAPVKPHASVNAVTFYKQYHANAALWNKAFLFIKNTDLNSLAPGKYPIAGDSVYASVTEAPSKELDKANWESHQNYIDLQYVIRGKEKIGVAPVAKATVVHPYDAAKDVANYTTDGEYYVAEPGTFFLFFPEDAHRPNIKVDGYETVKKLVIKIRVAK